MRKTRERRLAGRRPESKSEPKKSEQTKPRPTEPASRPASKSVAVAEVRDEAFYERVREQLDEDAIANRRLGWDDPLSRRYREDPLVLARSRRRS